MTERQQSAIATPEEVLEVLTSVLRGEHSEKPADQLRAAEHLAKHYGILTPREDPAPVKTAVAGEIEAAVRALKEERDGHSDPGTAD